MIQLEMFSPTPCKFTHAWSRYNRCECGAIHVAPWNCPLFWTPGMPVLTRLDLPQSVCHPASELCRALWSAASWCDDQTRLRVRYRSHA